MPSGERIKLKGGGAKYSLSLYNRRLIIINPKGEDAGIYECEASFGIGGAGSVVRTTANLSVLGEYSMQLLIFLYLGLYIVEIKITAMYMYYFIALFIA